MTNMLSELGVVVSVTGKRAVVSLNVRRHGDVRIAVGKLVAIRTPFTLLIGVVARHSGPGGGIGDVEHREWAVEVDFLGEIPEYGSAQAHFQRGVSEYPAVGEKMFALSTEDLRLIHRITDAETINLGYLKLDASVPAYVNFDEMLRKHFAVLGATGVGKSSAVALILREILRKRTNLRVLLIDPHAEYNGCFGDMSSILTVQNLKLPYWLFNFEEILEVVFQGQPGVEREKEILAELIPVAKARFAAATKMRHAATDEVAANYTPDLPVPYLISDLVELLNERLGKLENKSSSISYHRLISRIGALTRDARFSFMFDRLFVKDVMKNVLDELFGLSPGAGPITVMQIAGFPSEVVDSVVSVLCRLAFEFGTWSDGAVPLLVACEEAHRYAPADPRFGFWPTRKAISRIAKEGRKYSVFLGVITQRPADLDPTILSQCSTVFAMRMANDRDQEIIKSAVPDAGSSLIDVLSSLGLREAIAFGEGVALPTRIHFADLERQFIPFSQTEGRIQFDAAEEIDMNFVEAIIDRWRGGSARDALPRPRRSPATPATEFGLALDDKPGLPPHR